MTKQSMPARVTLAASLGTLLAMLVWGVLPHQPQAQVSHPESGLHTAVEAPLTHSGLDRYTTSDTVTGQQTALVLPSDQAPSTKSDHNNDVHIVLTSSASPPIPPVPVIPQPVPVAPQPVPVAPQPMPVAPQPVPVIPQPVPVIPQPVPVIPQPKPVIPQPVPVIPQPKPVIPQPVPVIPQPKPVIPQPVPVFPHPKPVFPHPKPVQPIPVIPQPVIPQPTPVPPPTPVVPPLLARVPNLVGDNLTTAEQLLAQSGLTVGLVTYQVSDQPAGTVLQTSPEPNTLIPSGSTVNLVIAE
jgi:hypothetical protein